MTTPSPDPEATAARVDREPHHVMRARVEQFAPGTIVAGRYGIAGILGSGAQWVYEKIEAAGIRLVS